MKRAYSKANSKLPLPVPEFILVSILSYGFVPLFYFTDRGISKLVVKYHKTKSKKLERFNYHALSRVSLDFDGDRQGGATLTAPESLHQPTIHIYDTDGSELRRAHLK